MAHKAGHVARFTFGGTTVEADGWTLHGARAHHRFVPFYGGQYSVVAENVTLYEGTATGKLDPSDSGQNAVLVLGATGTAYCYEDATSNYWTGTAYITDVRQEARIGSAQRFTIAFIASGDWSRT